MLICLITHDRLAYTKRTLKSLIDTIDIPYYLVVVDNNSTDGTQKWLEKNGPQDLLILNPANYYPGKACNIGWERGLRECDAQYLMRLDNDMEFSKGWAKKALEYFEKMPPLGQLGLDFTALDSYNGNPDYLSSVNGEVVNMWPGNVGGPCIIRREAWERGIRWDETPWYHEGDGKPTAQEDVKFSFAMHKYGYIYGHATEKLAWTFATPETWKEYEDYYKKTMAERGYKYESNL